MYRKPASTFKFESLFLEKTAAKMAEVEQKKKQTFWKFTYGGVDLD